MVFLFCNVVFPRFQQKQVILHTERNKPFIINYMKQLSLYLFLLLPFVSAWSYQKERINVTCGGKQRNMLVFTPDELPENSPLFITTHGMGGNSDEQSDHDKMYELVDTAKFVMVYPRADGDYWDISGTSDQNFIIKVIDEMASRYKINRKRVYWSGFSMGSMLIFHCMPNMLDRIAAFAPTSGILFSEEPWKRCAKKVNVMESIAYNDNAFTYNKYNIRGFMENMANMNRYTKYVKATGYHTKNGTSWFDGDRELWLNEETGHEVVLYSYNYSGKGSHTPVAENSYEIWNWCKRFELNPNAPGSSTQEGTPTTHYEAAQDGSWGATPTSGIASGSYVTFDGMKATIGAESDNCVWTWHAGNQGLIPSQMPSVDGTAEGLVTSFANTEPFGMLPAHGAFIKLEPTAPGQVTISGKASANAAQPLIFITCTTTAIETVTITPWDYNTTQWTYDVDEQHTYYFLQLAYPGQLTAYRFTLRGISFTATVPGASASGIAHKKAGTLQGDSSHGGYASGARIYNISGIRHDRLQQGLNIVKAENGSIMKVMSR